MTLFKRPFSRRMIFVVALGGLTVAGASAGTVHRMSVTQSNNSGSLGSDVFLNTQSSGGALQAQVGPSTLTSLSYPFGLFGLYNSSQVGFGVVGLSTTAYGVAGQSTSSYASIYGLSGGTGAAVEGVVPSSVSSDNYAIYGDNESQGYAADFYSANSDGVDAYAATDGWGGYFVSNQYTGIEGISEGQNTNGVLGTSNSGDGVHGSVTNTYSGVAGINAGTGYGTYGSNTYTAATPAPAAAPYTNAGIYGQTSVGTGIYGVSLNTGVAGYDSQRSAGVFGFGNGGPGLEGHSNSDIGVYGQTNSTTYPAIFGETVNATTSPSLYVFNDDTNDITIAYANGNFYTSGSITSGSDTYQAVTRNPGTDMTTYSAQHTEATVEDFGSAQLINGAATIPLATDFRQTINTALPYMVFLTPNGDTKGLYVASKTPAGFVVRETQSGRGTLSFDYRIVARPYGSVHARLPHLASLVTIPDRARMRALAANRASMVNGAAPAERTFETDTKRARLDKAHGKFVRKKVPAAPANMFRLTANRTL